jgi:Tfp pilus assembly protein PilF
MIASALRRSPFVSAVFCTVAVLGACSRAGRDDTPRAAPLPVPTFNKDVAPIVFEHCAPCHRPGQAAPFPLLGYTDARERADKILRATSSRRMPPWLPDLDARPVFVGERRLSAGELDVIERWVKGGTPEGNAADRPAPPTWPDGWALGTPDLVVTLPRPYTLKPAPAGGHGSHDVFRNVIFPVALPEGRFVRAVEFRPGAAPVVHHAVISLDPTRASRHRDGADGQVGFDGMIAQDAVNPDGHFLGWTPGRGPIVAPDGLPWRLERGSDLVVQLHLLPGTRPVDVRPTIGLFFTDRPPAGSPVMVRLGSKTIEIPVGESNYAISDSYVLPVDVDLLGVYPHAHYLGKEMHAEAALPGGATRPLLHIRKWDFHWQQDYRYLTPVSLPRGTRLSMRYTYDNSAANQRRAHEPPRPVTYGPNSSDEMGDLWLQLLPRTAAGKATLVAAFAEREAAASLASAQMLVRREPGNAAHQASLGGSYFQAGRLDEAAVHLDKALALDPRSAQAHNYMGGVRFAQRRMLDAIAHFRRAAELSPRDERMHFNLGNALSATGQASEAARAFERAIAVNPEFAGAHQNLGVFFASRRDLAKGIVHLRRAAELAPESPETLSDLGAVLALAGEIDEARRVLRRALELKPDYRPAMDNLARLDRRP